MKKINSMKKIEKDDPETKSPDIVAQNIDQLRLIFPEAFTEGKIDFDVLKQLLGSDIDEKEEKYGLNWHGKRKARQLALTPSIGTLRPCPEESVDWDTTQNLMIEGDNLEVLKLLQKSYAGQVKLIYIDPPYNTGKDFVYVDDYSDNIKNYQYLMGWRDQNGEKLSSLASFKNTATSGRFHTDWLNMMYPRIKLAKDLLRNEGLIFISIDDGEAASLRIILNEVFGEENFLANLVWQKKYSPQNDDKYYSDTHEHVIVFAKNIEKFEIGLLPRTEEANSRYKNPDNDPRGPWKSGDLTRQEYRERDDYEIVSPLTGKRFRPPKGNSWGRPKDIIEKLIKDNRISFGPDGNSVPALKRFLSEVKQGITPQTILFRQDVGDTQEGKKIIKELFGDVSVFETAKPIRLIQHTMITGNLNNNDIVLDFFAGSGTTGHAVLAYNVMTGSGCKYILIQLPEPTERTDYPTIAEITKERLRRAGQKIKDDNPMFAGDLGFRVFKLDSSNIKAWEPDREDLPKTLQESAEHLKADRTEEDILFELLLKLGLDLTVPIEKKKISKKMVYSIGAGTLFVCLDKKVNSVEIEPLALGMVKWHKELSPAGETTIVFRDSAFENDVAKTNLTAILQQHGLENVRSL